MVASVPFNWIEPLADAPGAGAPFNWLEPLADAPGTSAPFNFIGTGNDKIGAFVRIKQLGVAAPFPAFITTVSALPNPVGLVGHYAYVSDAVGGGVLVFSDNLKWRRWTDRSEVI